jgi:hypothetical protein
MISLGVDESPISLCSRVALVVGRTAREFCLDMGFRFQDIVDGDRTALEALAFHAQVEAEPLIASATVKTGSRRYSLSGQDLVREVRSRQTLRICPHCLLESLESGNGPVEARPFGKTSWLIAPMRTCLDHRTALVEVHKERRTSYVYDFARLIQPHLLKLEHLVTYAPRRQPSGLEQYLQARRSGMADSAPWLNELPFYAAARACEMIGAVSIYGIKVRAESLADEDWHEAGSHGFEIASRGTEGIRQFLLDLRTGFTATRAAWGPQLVLGRLYDWLAYQTADPAFDPLRDLIRRHLIETMPVGPGDAIFGQAVPFRQLHSVRSASLEFGSHPKRLRKLLHAAGFIPTEALSLSDDRVTFDAEQANEFLERAAETMSLKQAGMYINAPRPHEQLLYKAGFIRPLVLGGVEDIKDHALARRDLDEFLDRLLTGTVEAGPSDNHLLSIPAAAKKARCSATQIVALILDRKLSRVRRRTDVSGFLSVLVDPAEIRPYVCGEDHRGHSLREVMRILQTTTRVVRALIDHGHLHSTAVPNPVTRCRQEIVLKDELETFQLRYVSLHVTAKEKRIQLQKLRWTLASASIIPAFDPTQVHATFYERPHVQAVIGQAVA